MSNSINTIEQSVAQSHQPTAAIIDRKVRDDPSQANTVQG
jgi:hypothetical protein